MPPADVALSLCLAAPALKAVRDEVFPQGERRSLSRDELRPHVPFAGPLFELFGRLARGSCVGLVVPVWPPDFARTSDGPATGELLAVADHVNLELRGPLTGPWPAGVPRDFPQMTGVYQPAYVRASGGPRVYSSGVVAGVADSLRLTAFEAQAVSGLGVAAVSDVLVPVAIVAAYYGLTLAACGVPQTGDNDEQ